jgi:4-amino-4-deoxychorismate lyase
MCRLIETIRVENGEPSLLAYHQERLRRSQEALFDLKEPCNLEKHLSAMSLPQNGLWKCRVTYHTEIEKTEFEPYQRKSIQSLQVVEANDIRYDYKFAQRDGINILLLKKREADDILIVRNNLLTDTSYCNIALWNGMDWITPLQPLLNGVRRASLIQSGKVNTGNIRLKDLSSFRSFKLFNAMISFEEADEISTSFIFFKINSRRKG